MAAKQTAPEAFDLRNILIDAWQPFANEHHWSLPDGFHAIVKVMTKKETDIKVPELKSSFTHYFTVNEGTERGLSLAA